MKQTYEEPREGKKEKRQTPGAAEPQDSGRRPEELAAQSPGPYVSSRAEELDALAETIRNRPAFHYDAEADPLYRQYRDQATTMGRLAMEDTMGKAAGLTGGMGSTYSQQAGQQAYAGYLQQLNDMVPKLYEQALALYDREGEQLMEQYSLLQGREDRDYDRYSDDFDRWFRQYDLAQELYTSDRKLDYQQYLAMLESWQKQEELRQKMELEWAKLRQGG